MSVKTNETHLVQNAERSALEKIFKSMERRLERPAEEIEICDAIESSHHELSKILDQIKELIPGSFHKEAFQNGDTENKPPIQYTPATSKADSSLAVRKSEIRERLTRAIEALPEMERLIISLYYYDELTLKEIESVLGINENSILQLLTKAMLRIRSRLIE